MTKDEALKLALEALENWWGFDPENWGDTDNKAITAIREALAQPEQERTWQGLTDEKVLEILGDIDADTKRLPPGIKAFARAIEAHLKENNT